MRAAARCTQYWLLKTTMSSDSVRAFYRTSAPIRGWTVEMDTPPLLILSQDSGRMVLFVSDPFPQSGTKVLYGYTATGRS